MTVSSTGVSGSSVAGAPPPSGARAFLQAAATKNSPARFSQLASHSAVKSALAEVDGRYGKSHVEVVLGQPDSSAR